jgi:hypothetical protein
MNHPASISALAIVLCSSGLTGCLGEEPEEPVLGEDTQAVTWGAPIQAGGSFSCDFSLPGDIPLDQVPPIIERDRMYMAERPGLQNKHLPLAFDNATGNLFSGGRYLFDTEAQAHAYKNWVENDFNLDGTLFLERPIFIAPECHAWKVIGAHQFAPLETSQVILRTERGTVHSNVSEKKFQQLWPQIRAEANQRGLSAIWLLLNKAEGLAQIVYFADRVGPPDPMAPDFASLAALEKAPPLAPMLSSTGFLSAFDRTQWVLTIWFPFIMGDQGEPSLWQYSPPFPQPFCGDTVCESSRGEVNAGCAIDCPVACGDAACQVDENTQNCPGDCRI